MSFTMHHTDGLVFLTSPLLDAQAGQVRHAFSTRVGGVSRPPFDSLNLGIGRGDDPQALLENYRRFCAAAGGSPRQAVLSRQVHTDTVRVVTRPDAGKGLFLPQDYEADALVTDEPGLSLVVFSADCGILTLYDPVHRAIGAVHAGWRGCAAGIVEKAVHTMTEAYGTQPADILAAVGPCIGPCCFETDEDVPTAMRAALHAEAEPYIETRGAKWHVDLAGLNRQWLLRAGVRPERIDLAALCTACHPELFWSHRRMGNARGAQIAMVTLL